MSRATQRGFTLVELMTVLVVMSLVIALAVPAADSWSGADTRRASGHLAGMLRYVFEEATIRRVTLRVALNLDRGTVWVEETSGVARIFRDEAERRAAADRAVLDEAERTEHVEQANREMEQATQALAELQSQQGTGTAGTGTGLLTSIFGGIIGGTVAKPYEGINRFQPVEDEELGRARPLPGGVSLVAAWTPAFEDVQRPTEDGPPEDPTEDRVVYIHAFSSGYLEDAFVVVGRGENTQSVITDPLTGRIKVEDGEVDPRSFRLAEREVER